MAIGFAGLARWWADVFGTGGCPGTLSLLVRLENADDLRADLGAEQVERMLDRLTLRLVSDLHLLPQPRPPGMAEIGGALRCTAGQKSSALLDRLREACRRPLDPGVGHLLPEWRGMLIHDPAGRGPTTGLERGRAYLTDAGRDGHGWIWLDLTQASAEVLPVSTMRPTRLGYQPQICSDTGALISLYVHRGGWTDQGICVGDTPALGPMDADLRQALSDLRGWLAICTSLTGLTWPLTQSDLDAPELADTLLWEIDRQDLLPRHLELELSEPMARLTSDSVAASNLHRLAAAGCRLALGNFGAGGAGLAGLRRHGIARVRIGREFVAECDRRADQQRMILAVLALAEHLRLATIADGVATREECAFLTQIGFSAVQGPAIGPVLAAERVAEHLRAHAAQLPQPYELRRRA